MELPVNDTIPGSQPAVLRRLSVRRGLLVEAYAELGHTLHHMLQVQIQVRERAYCLSLFGEDLVENFDATLQRILKLGSSKWMTLGHAMCLNILYKHPKLTGRIVDPYISPY